MENTNVKLNMFVMNKVFLLLDFIGVTTISLNAILLNNNNTILTLGLTFLTLGVTIPISLYFQTKQNNDTFEIINACHNYGIENIYEGRKYNESYKRMRDRVDIAFNDTRNLLLLGIAFPELLNPETASDSSAKRRLKDTNINLKIIVLNPDSPAASRRARIEDPDQICNEGETICNIRNTIVNHTKILFRARLENKYGKDWKMEIAEIKKSIKNEEFYKKIIDDIKMQIKITDFDPISFILATDHTLFSEQYSFGRPEFMDSTATCVGGYLPVIQYKKFSKGYDFLKSHFVYIWNSKECTTDITEKHLQDVLKTIL